MCILSYFPTGIQPVEDHLINGAIWNKDGHGWAIIHRGDLTIGKSMSPERAIDAFMTERARKPDGPAMFHSRWATHGTVNLDNVHPFYVGRDRRTVLAHNGILSAPALPHAGDHRSDSWKFAETILPKWGRVDSPFTSQRISRFLGGYNKIVVLTANPTYKHASYIFNAEAGIFLDDGTWHSNHDFAQRQLTVPGWGRGDDDEAPWLPDEAIVECPFCGSRAIDQELKYCEGCWTCLECFADSSRCMCYLPTKRMLGDDERARWWE
jgi:hypothetical protein